MHRTPRTRRPGLVAAAILSAVLLVSACGAEVSSGDTTALSNDTPDPTHVVTPDPQPDPDADGEGSDDHSEDPGTDSGTPDNDDSDPPAPENQEVRDESDSTAIMLVMDASGSMNEADLGDGETTRLAAAKDALRGVVNGLGDGTNVGLRVFGSTSASDDREVGCRDTELIHPVAPLDRAAMLDAIDGFQAAGWTPIGQALRDAGSDLPPEGPRSIILVSDGEDTCAPPPPCEVAADLAEDGIDLTIHTVGFALEDNEQAREELGCIADVGHGVFYDVDSADELANTLRQITQREERRVVAEGIRFEGAPIPQRANTGQLNTTYTDVVLREEENFYRFEITPGTTLQADVLVVGNDSVDDGCGPLHLGILFTNEQETSSYFTHHFTSTRYPTETLAASTLPRALDTDEVWFKIETRTPSNQRCDSQGQFDVEFVVKTVD
ncbi:vWA domain-containing protein [Phytoactinopolyspora limicola]|uniref:vWA domain-containing protein n=1 Tax=Phytoactinopolyspora limicola TaxID=2715536 RepID=UPI00140942E3|nr:VWA domain-containing protein [Phytoactinopolyspora limicola]